MLPERHSKHDKRPQTTDGPDRQHPGEVFAGQTIPVEVESLRNARSGHQAPFHAPANGAQEARAPTTQRRRPGLLRSSAESFRPTAAEKVPRTVLLAPVVWTFVKVGAKKLPWLESAEMNVPTSALRMATSGVPACHLHKQLDPMMLSRIAK